MIGHMSSCLPYFHRPLARLLTTLNQNVVKVETASTFTSLERQTIAMLHNIFYKLKPSFYDTFTQSPDSSLGIVCSGGTIANITAMWIARNKALDGALKDGVVKAMNRGGYESAVIIGSELMHYSFRKAADVLGFGETGLCLIPTDENFRIRVDLLQEKIIEFRKKNVLIISIVAVCGTTETGSIDPLYKICQLGSQYGIHVHVDAAWGGPLIFSNEHMYKLKGIELADSITVDGHKQLYTPMGIGVLLLKSPFAAHVIRKTAHYVIRNDSPDLGKFTLEGSRPANVLYLNASLNLLGRDGLSVLMTRSCTLVKQMSVRLSHHPSKSFQILHEPQTNLLLYRYIPTQLRTKSNFSDQDNELMNVIVERVQNLQSSSQDGNYLGFTSRTTVSFQSRLTRAFRIVISNPLTQWQDIENVIQDHLILGNKVERQVDLEEKHRRLLQQYPFDSSTFWIGWPFDI
jgi:glutamate decarboxylase